MLLSVRLGPGTRHNLLGLGFGRRRHCAR
jgi:hypothetical protein